MAFFMVLLGELFRISIQRPGKAILDETKTIGCVGKPHWIARTFLLKDFPGRGLTTVAVQHRPVYFHRLGPHPVESDHKVFRYRLSSTYGRVSLETGPF
jgi:hypothetical protein